MRALKFLDAIAGSLDSTSEQRHIEKCIRDLINAANDNCERVEKQCQELEADENSIMSKIKKKQTELERVEKRLKNLQSVRPAFMDEYEKLEKELERYYEVFIDSATPSSNVPELTSSHDFNVSVYRLLLRWVINRLTLSASAIWITWNMS